MYLLLTMQTLSEMYSVSLYVITILFFIKKDIRIYLWLHLIDKISCNNNPFRRLRLKDATIYENILLSKNYF